MSFVALPSHNCPGKDIMPFIIILWLQALKYIVGNYST